MNRRELLKLVGLGVVNHTLDLDKLLWIPGQKKIFIPSGKELSLLGIPYYISDCSMGAWLGIRRNQNAMNELVNLIRIMEKNKIR
jgi:hypothetical protein